MMDRPSARRDDLLVTETIDGTLVYDTRTHHIHHLNPVCAAIWKLSDGHHTVDDLVMELPGTIDAPATPTVVADGLAMLARADLLVQPLPSTPRRSGHSRRSFLKRSAGATAIALPAIVSVTAPTAQASATEPLPTCLPLGASCQPGVNDDCCPDDGPFAQPRSCRADEAIPDGQGGYIYFYHCVE